jgi:hypothetical protein
MVGPRGVTILLCRSSILMDLLTRRVLHRHEAATGSVPERLLRARLDRIADQVKRLVNDALVQPQMPLSGVVDELREILDDAEYE